jgi:hypothetical protein
MIAAHMHVSVDGSQVLNYAQRTFEQAHHELVGTAPERVGSIPRYVE